MNDGALLHFAFWVRYRSDEGSVDGRNVGQWLMDKRNDEKERAVARRGNEGSVVVQGKPEEPRQRKPRTHAEIVSSEGGRMMLKHAPPQAPRAVAAGHRPVRISRPRNVLSEEEYASSLQKIITRDYFESEADERGPDELAGMSLDEYQRRHTTEDNDSFGSLLEAENARKRERAPWLWSSDSVRRKQITVGSERMLIEYHRDDDNKPRLRSSREPRSALMYPADPDPSVRQPAHAVDIRRDRTRVTKSASPPPSSSASKNGRAQSSDPDAAPTVGNFGFVTENTYKPGYIVPGPSREEMLRDALLEKKMETRKTESAAAKAASRAGIGRIAKLGSRPRKPASSK